MLSRRPAKGGEGLKKAVPSLSEIVTQTLEPSRARMHIARLPPSLSSFVSRTSTPSPASTVHTSVPPSSESVATVDSLQMQRLRSSTWKSAKLSFPPLPPTCEKTAALCSSVKVASGFPESSASLSRNAANSSALAVLPLEIVAQMSSAFWPDLPAWACTAAAAACACVAAASADLSSASRGAATLVATSMSACSCARPVSESWTSCCATKRCSRSVHCFDSLASSTWHCVSLDWSFPKSAVIGPRRASAKVFASCTRSARNFFASAVAACASCSAWAISSQTLRASSAEMPASLSSPNLVMVFASFCTETSTPAIFSPEACI
mmetsp:Transcript_67806/g.192188  ORF Transcript_67806/g.192188 Transcript_67806/m.192188 type:complete len:323 (-) Transcript_67806:3079-4047(-)